MLRAQGSGSGSAFRLVPLPEWLHIRTRSEPSALYRVSAGRLPNCNFSSRYLLFYVFSLYRFLFEITLGHRTCEHQVS